MIQKNGAGVSPEIEDVWPTGEWPKHCGTQMVGVEYDYTSPERYDGISEYRCKSCDIRIGRWSGKKLEADELEPKYGIYK